MQHVNVQPTAQTKKAAEFTRLKSNTRPIKQGFYVVRNGKEAQKKTGKMCSYSKQNKTPTHVNASAWNYGSGVTKDGKWQPVAWARLTRDTRSLVQ